MQAAHASGEVINLEAEWPLQAMTWLATNAEDRSRLCPYPLPVTVVLSESQWEQLPVLSATLPPTVASRGGYRPDVDSIGEFDFCFCFLLFDLFLCFSSSFQILLPELWTCLVDLPVHQACASLLLSVM